jgi:hypothetical protein
MTGASGGHITNLKQSILETFDVSGTSEQASILSTILVVAEGNSSPACVHASVQCANLLCYSCK